jgi:hypothetical protein
MRHSTSRAILGYIWFLGAIPLFCILAVQSIVGVYGGEWQEPWNWLLPLITPNLSLIIAVWKVRPLKLEEQGAHSAHMLFLMISLSVAYLGLLYAVLILGRASSLPFRSVLADSAWYLLPFQMIVAAMLAKFFINGAD